MTKLKRAHEIEYNPEKRKSSGSVRVPKVSNVNRSNLALTDHIWAQNGEVYWRSKDGESKHMNPLKALQLAQQINRDITKFANKPENSNLADLKRKRDELVEKLIHAARRAIKERKHPEGEVQRLLSCAYHGVNRHGEKITAESTFNDKVLADAKHDFPFLNEEDILTIIRSPELTPNQATQLLRAENAKRETQYHYPEATKQVAI